MVNKVICSSNINDNCREMEVEKVTIKTGKVYNEKNFPIILKDIFDPNRNGHIAKNCPCH